MHLLFDNGVIDKEMPKITSHVKGRMIILNKHHLSDWLNLSLKGPNVFFSNKLVTIIPSLTKEVQLSIIFNDDFTEFDGLSPHKCLTKDAHILHNMLT